ncbi:hypothetical protein D3C84_578770 [compost metagenome]
MTTFSNLKRHWTRWPSHRPCRYGRHWRSRCKTGFISDLIAVITKFIALPLCVGLAVSYVGEEGVDINRAALAALFIDG